MKLDSVVKFEDKYHLDKDFNVFDLEGNKIDEITVFNRRTVYLDWFNGKTHYDLLQLVCIVNKKNKFT